ncbi:Amidohydrolase family protein [Bacillus sp. OK838]|nr:Amidohydrolase family protein [Bacillus sp. OK838]
MLKAFEDLDNAGKLTFRYDLGLWADETKGTEQIGRFKEARDKYQGELYKIDTIKIFSDGVGDNQLVWDQEILEETVAALDKEGFRVYIHAIGILWPKEKASLEEKITSYTINGANVIFAEDERGSIEVGKKADLIVWVKISSRFQKRKLMKRRSC